MKFKKNKWITHFVLVSFIFLLLPTGHATATDTEEKGLTLLKEGKELHEKFDYNGAMDRFLKARIYLKSRENLSRLYFAMSVTYYSLDNKAKTREVLLQLFDIDPGKQIQEEDYPRGYIEIFNQTREGKEIKTEVIEEPAKKIESETTEPEKTVKKKVIPKKKAENGTLEKVGFKKEKKKKKFPVLIVVLGAVVVAGLIALLAGGSGDTTQDEVFDIRGTWDWTLVSLDGETVNVTTEIHFTGGTASGTLISDSMDGTYTVSGRNVELRSDSGSVYTGTFQDHTHMAGGGTHHSGAAAVWKAVKK